MIREKMLVTAVLLQCIATTVYADTAETQYETKQQYNQLNAWQTAPHVEAPIDMPTIESKPIEANRGILVIPQETIMFPIQHIEVISSSPVFANYKDTFSRYEGERIGAKGIEALRRSLGLTLVNKGYITTIVTVPDQDIAKGTLLLEIKPGYIEDIQVQGGYGTWKTAMPTAPGHVLNVRDLEQGLEQFKRVSNQNVSMELLPGSKVGYSIVSIKREQSSPVALQVSLDDAGYQSTGRLETSVTMQAYNPLGLNDILTATYGKDVEANDGRKGSHNYNVSYSIPYGNFTATINRYHYDYLQSVAGIMPYQYEGTTNGLSISLEKMIHRNQTSKTSGVITINRKSRTTAINDVEIGVQKQRSTSLELGLKHRQYIGKGQLDWYVYARKGVPYWGAEPAVWDGVGDNPTIVYNLYGASVQWQQPLSLGSVKANYSMRLVGQLSRDTLYTTDQLSIGGRYTVRGFSGEHTLSGESGFYMRNDLSFPLQHSQLTPYIALDAGRVMGPSTDYIVGKSLVGMAIGIRGPLGSHIYGDVFMGTPIYKPEGFQAGKTALGFSVSASI